ncbi:MAG: hypothetical protein RLZZ292_241 [Bacteroidota bacterium]|jgi:hypothetical protein
MKTNYAAIIRLGLLVLVLGGLGYTIYNGGLQYLKNYVVNQYEKQNSAATEAVKDTQVVVVQTMYPAQHMSDSLESYSDIDHLWPIPIPKIIEGSLLPKSRILAFYGNLYATKMGVLGEYPKQEMLAKLMYEKQRWQQADTTHPIQLALHAVVTTAQAKPGREGKYCLRSNANMVDTLLAWAKEINAVVFLDIQTGKSNVMTEIPAWEKYLKMPNVHLGLDPEFSIKNNGIPGKDVGALDDKDVNWAIDYLKKLVLENHLPPKVLIVHRFKKDMLINPTLIKPQSEVQFVLDMDGWGSKELKLSTQYHWIYGCPIEFTGFKLFYKNDTRAKDWAMMTPEEVLSLYPAPLYIQYQ